ncbi:MAG: hypothetical protein C4297_07095 [Gemmataceae bacterium]
MAVARHRFGPQFIVRVAVDSATEIKAGDAVFLDGDDAKPAGSEPWVTDLATTQANFVNHFLGIAQADHPAGSGDVRDFPVDISPLSVYELDCAAETHEIGDTLGMAKASGNALVADQVRKAAAAASCFRCVRRDPIAASRVYVRMQSAYWGINDATRQ